MENSDAGSRCGGLALTANWPVVVDARKGAKAETELEVHMRVRELDICSHVTLSDAAGESPR